MELMAKRNRQRATSAQHRSKNRSSELEKIVAELESGKLGLSDALARYEEGVKHLKGCQQLLEMAERKIELLERRGC